MLDGPIGTARLLIRPFQAGDEQAVHTYMSDPAVTTYLPEGTLSADGSRAFVARNLGAEAEALAVTLGADGPLVGHMLFHPWFAEHTYEIGWAFNRAFHNRGYASEAAAALLAHAFERLHCHRVIATCQPENGASFRVMEKLGMRREGHFRQCIHRGGELWWDEYFYAILADEWVAAHLARPVEGG